MRSVASSYVGLYLIASDWGNNVAGLSKLSRAAV